MTKENNHQDNRQPLKDNKIERSGSSGSFEVLKEHDNSSLLSILNQIDSNNKKEK